MKALCLRRASLSTRLLLLLHLRCLGIYGSLPVSHEWWLMYCAWWKLGLFLVVCLRVCSALLSWYIRAFSGGGALPRVRLKLVR